MDKRSSKPAHSVVAGLDRGVPDYLNSRLKRSLDIVVGLVGLLILGLVMIPVSLAVKFDSSGPVFYRQRRLGAEGKPFSLLKFRTMSTNAEDDGVPKFALTNDDRVTRVGYYLRRSYVDELPQWWNVFKGDMSVVGPRPERPEISEKIVAKYPKFGSRTDTKPGITGLAQIEYGYVNSIEDSKHKLSYDQLYISRASLKIDLWIILRTMIHAVNSRGT